MDFRKESRDRWIAENGQIHSNDEHYPHGFTDTIYDESLEVPTFVRKNYD